MPKVTSAIRVGGRRAAPTAVELGLPAEPPVVKASACASDHARARVDTQVRALLAYQEGTRSGRDPEDLHQFRVAIRRLRSLLKASPMFGAAGEVVRGELRWLGGVTSPVRDRDVLLMRLREIIEDFDLADQVAAQHLLAALTAERGRHRRALGRALSGKRYANLLDRTTLLAVEPVENEEAALPDLAVTQLIGSLRKPYRKLRTAVEALPDDAPDDEFHTLRLLVKRLRYAAEMTLGSARKKEAKQLKTLIGACKNLQEVLGDHQDAVVAIERVGALVEQVAATEARAAFVAGRIVEREHARRTRLRNEWPQVWDRIIEASAPLLAS